MEIEKEEVLSLLNSNSSLIDIREPYLFARGHIKQAVNIPLGSLRRLYDKYLDKNKTYYLICETGFNSKRMANILNEKGYKVYSIKNGYN